MTVSNAGEVGFRGASKWSKDPAKSTFIYASFRVEEIREKTHGCTLKDLTDRLIRGI
jgi:hypothetical protein